MHDTRPELKQLTDKYIEDLCSQIRWKKAHKRVSAEMASHIQDSSEAYIAQGIAPDDAIELAIKDSGDPATLGLEFDRVHRPAAQWGMLAWVAGFLVLGLALSLFLFDEVGASRRLIFTGIGLAVMFAAYFADFTLLGKRPWLVCFGVVVACWGLFYFMQLWRALLFPPWQYQNITLVFPVVLAGVIFSQRSRGYIGLVFCLLAFLLLSHAAFVAPALSGFVHFSIAGMGLVIITILKGWFGVNRLAGVALAFLPYFLALLFMVFVLQQGSWMTTRVITAFNPSNDPVGMGFISLQIRALLSQAYLLGESPIPQFFPQRWLYGELVLVAVIHRFGWLPFTGVILGIGIFVAGLVAKARRQRSGLGFFVSMAVILTFGVQVIMYILYNLGFVFSQISLPLVSPGGLALIINMGLVGFMLSVFRTGNVAIDPPMRQLFKWENGRVIVSFKR